ncbi:metallophosphoesterase [Agromyces bracchium]|uniref:Phosphohydrolase n=2 Tax=Agromyces bracchium TaxID=88376 RepID=A0A6I3M6J2_9MICO|nr:phosphohydrolase [Agromyces bracchium]
MRRGAAIAAGAAAVLALTGCLGPGSPGGEPAGTDGRSITFTASGDIGMTDESAATLADVGRLDPDAHFALGDLSYGEPGAEGEWCDFVTGHVGDAVPVELLAGNHESDGLNGDIAAFAECLPNRLDGLFGDYARQYAVDLPADAPLVRLVMISPGITFPDGTWTYDRGSERYDWTLQAIEDARSAGIPWVVVGMHKPCLSVGNYDCDPGPELVDMLVESGVDLVIGGHEHLYQRTAQLAVGEECPSVAPEDITAACVADGGDDLVQGDGTVFVTVGTGGTTLRDIRSDDTDAPYFAAWSGANADPSWGNLEVRVSEEALDLDFRAAVGSFTDHVEIRAAG